MAKNVLIFCDGTGQVGGLRFDETRTNVYKLYRAMRCGPDSAIDPATQVAFYDPGIGSSVDGGRLIGSLARALYNIVAQATGFGITRNIIDCYAAVIRLWEPGDRIWLFGFSRGAYTARCVAEALALCGIPRQEKNGTPLKLDPTSVRKVASYAVKHVYQFTSPCPPGVAKGRKADLERTRLALAERFRTTHAAPKDAGDGTYPYFVGVFDTVAALINPQIAIGLFVGVIVVASLLAFALTLMLSPYGARLATFGWTFASIVGVGGLAALAAYVWTHFKVDYEGGLSAWPKTAHMTDATPKFYDENLDPEIAYAKHAISIDENRAAFAKVPWGHARRGSSHDAGGRPWFEQVWFAGNHADIGGGYSENESRLSDIALEWMLDCACEVPGDLKFDPAVLRTWPSPIGPQHDQVKAGFGWLTRLTTLTWPAAIRQRSSHGAILHESVYDRFDAASVPYWDGDHPYRPETFRGYADVDSLYRSPLTPGTKAERHSTARKPKSAR